MQTILTVKNICKTRLGDTSAENSNNFTLCIDALTIHKGELVALVGASGCGKSTALDLVAGILRPEKIANKDKGPSFIFTPQDADIDMLSHWKAKNTNALAHIRKKHLGYILQTGGLLPFLTGKENICLAGSGNDNLEIVHDIAQKLDITHLLHKKPAHMSVGERQRFAIARALYTKPQLILADEPVASLDPVNAKAVLQLFTTLAKEEHISILMVSHAPTMAQEMGFRLVHTQVGRVEKHIISRIGYTPPQASSKEALHDC